MYSCVIKITFEKKIKFKEKSSKKNRILTTYINNPIGTQIECQQTSLLLFQLEIKTEDKEQFR